MLDTLIVKHEKKEKTAFYASDCLKPAWELYHKFVGTEETNPINWKTMLRLGAGNGVEDSLLRVLKDSDVVNQDYDQHVHGKVSYDRDGISIHGRIDAITKEGLPIEIKSINNNNSWDINAYRDGYPRENYVGQLAVYMDYLKVDKGYLFVATIDGLQAFVFECTREGDIFTCGKTKFDLGKEINRWVSIYQNNVVPKIEPDIFEYRYKTPIEEIDWKTISKSKISKARTGASVIGDFHVSYSGYKDLWISKQGETLGYSDEEIKRIKELTDGYTTW